MLEQIMLAEQQAGINLTGTESWHVEIMLSTRQGTDKPQQLQLTGLHQTQQVTTCQKIPPPPPSQNKWKKMPLKFTFKFHKTDTKPYVEAVISMFFLHGFCSMCLLGNTIMYNREFLFDLP